MWATVLWSCLTANTGGGLAMDLTVLITADVHGAVFPVLKTSKLHCPMDTYTNDPCACIGGGSRRLTALTRQDNTSGSVVKLDTGGTCALVVVDHTFIRTFSVTSVRVRVRVRATGVQLGVAHSTHPHPLSLSSNRLNKKVNAS